MTTASLVPTIALPEGPRGPHSHAARGRTSLPLARMTPAGSARTGRMVYGLAKLDARGRAADAAVERALGWVPGARVDIRESGGLILVKPDPRGVFSITIQGHVRLPVAVRRWCGLVPGDRVLLAADGDEDLLVVYPPTTLDALVAGSRAQVVGGDAA